MIKNKMKTVNYLKLCEKTPYVHKKEDSSGRSRSVKCSTLIEKSVLNSHKLYLGF